MLHPVHARDLPGDQLRVHADVDMGRAQPLGLLQREADGGPLGHVVRRPTEALGHLGEDLAVAGIAQDRPGPGGPGFPRAAPSVWIQACLTGCRPG